MYVRTVARLCPSYPSRIHLHIALASPTRTCIQIRERTSIMQNFVLYLYVYSTHFRNKINFIQIQERTSIMQNFVLYLYVYSTHFRSKKNFIQIQERTSIMQNFVLHLYVYSTHFRNKINFIQIQERTYTDTRTYINYAKFCTIFVLSKSESVYYH